MLKRVMSTIFPEK